MNRISLVQAHRGRQINCVLFTGCCKLSLFPCQMLPFSPAAILWSGPPATHRLMDLIEKIRALPTKPGVYLYKNADGNVIYVGKAKNLRSRVRSYLLEAS